MVARFLTGIGAVVLAFFIYLGEVVMLAAESVRSALTHRMRWRLFLRQMVDIGLLSQLVVVITGGFTGAVFAAQTYFQFNKLGVASGVGAVVSAALFRELGPVLTGLMVTGRVGAAIRAQGWP
jgi:phospholipid/cholesterol/gamma-HCH transport system permease protein